jgi:hypothetical protein
MYKGKRISLSALAEAFNVSYDTCLRRYNAGERDPWKLLFGPNGKPVKFSISDEDIEFLQETRHYRKDQKQVRGRTGHSDNEWDIACDLIGIPRIFAKELEEAICSK